MKVLLLNPTLQTGEVMLRSERCQAKGFAGFGTWPPISLAEMAALLREEGHDVEILDAIAAGLPHGEMVERCAASRARMVVFQSTTPTLHDDLEAAKALAKRTEPARNVFFGLHATVRPEDILSDDVPFAIRGEPDITVCELARAIEEDRDPAAVAGLSYWRDGRAFHNPDRPLIEDIDSLPMAARDLLPNGKYVIPSHGGSFTIIKTSRGCPYECSFCTSVPYSRRRWRCRSAERVVDEMEQCVVSFGIRNFMFMSDTFNINGKWVLDLCRLIRARCLDVSWMCNSRVDTLTETQACAMKAAGCWLVSLGIESGSEEVLRRSGKGITTGQARRAVGILRRSGIKSLAYFMFGLPGETRESIEETIDFAVSLDPDYCHFFTATPFPGTAFFDLAVKEGWLTTTDWRRYFHGHSDVIAYPGLPASEIAGACKRAYRRFYLRPRVVLRQLREIRSATAMVRVSRTALQLIVSNLAGIR